VSFDNPTLHQLRTEALNGTIKLMDYWCQWITGEFTLNVHSQIIGVNPYELESYDFAPRQKV